MRERVSVGNLLTGRNMFRKESRDLRVSHVLASRLSIYGVQQSQMCIKLDFSMGTHLIPTKRRKLQGEE